MPAKYYVADNGLRKAVLYSQSSDEGKSLETVVHSSLLRGLGSEDRLFYFNENGSECDFLVQKGDRIDVSLPASENSGFSRCIPHYTGGNSMF